jgi:hypothetical protein
MHIDLELLRVVHNQYNNNYSSKLFGKTILI